MMKPVDNVAVALEFIPANSIVLVSCQNKSFTIEVLVDIEFGHKFAVTLIPRGTEVIKYGEVIGKSVNNINPGEHVHVHNIEGIRGRGDQVAVNK